MLHARNDYNARIQDSEGVIPANEPVFLLRGQDIFAPAMLELYANMVEINHAVSAAGIVRNTRKHAAAMRQWQKDKRAQFPDMNDSDSVY